MLLRPRHADKVQLRYVAKLYVSSAEAAAVGFEGKWPRRLLLLVAT